MIVLYIQVSAWTPAGWFTASFPDASVKLPPKAPSRTA